MNGRFEIRELEPGGPLELSGHGETFNQSYAVEGFTEIIRRGAFKRTLADNPDVSLLVNHAGLPLARTTSGTLQLRKDAHGLHFRARLDPSDPDVRQVVPKLERGDLSEASFAFRATKQEWSDDKSERFIQEINIHRGDVSIVTNAANQNATAGLRAEDLTLEQRERIAERVGNRVCGPYSALADGWEGVERVGNRLSTARAKRPLRRSYVEEAKAKRARLRGGRPSRAHPGSGASVDGEEDTPRYTDAEIQKLGEEGKAHKRTNGKYNFPIADRRDLLNAVKAWGRRLTSGSLDFACFASTIASAVSGPSTSGGVPATSHTSPASCRC